MLCRCCDFFFFFFSSRRRHTRLQGDWSSDVCSSDLGVSAPVAVIGIAEKGYVTVGLTAQAEGGHSSMPPDETAVGLLAAAITRLEHEQMPRAIRGPTADRKSTRLNSSHLVISYAVFCLKKKKIKHFVNTRSHT